METALTHIPNMTLLSGTLGIITSLISLFTLGIAWLRPSYPGWRSWSVGHAALVLGLLVGVVRTPQIMLLSIVLGNGLVMIGTGLFVDAFQRFGGQQPTKKMVWGQLVSTAVVLLMLVALTVYDNLTARYLLVTGYLLVQSMLLVQLFIRRIVAHPGLRSAYLFNFAVLIMVQVLSLPRMLMLASGKHPEAVFALNVPNLLMYFSVLLFSVGGTFAFWILHDDRRKHEVQQLHHKMTALAYNDPLTSVLNRRGLWEAFGCWSQAEVGTSSVLVVMDIDGFKVINDQQGHQVGDQHLKDLVLLLQEIAQPKDLIGRLGGDEFTLLLSGPVVQMTRQLNVLGGILSQGVSGALGFSVSFGHTDVERFESLDDALNRADQAMYRNKLARKLMLPAHGPAVDLAVDEISNVSGRRSVARGRYRQRH
ncbi:GGDEF domain-containing protein [Deinococcus alpinitundrae]|uniref:GGDEF domain-containing protein n=1 Tax=Deinococcus alpinitundrae TaxID=468913 RepID=UPI00137AF6F4|nr:GGDEF domain-containing protein [Deinococcus alpinitundrae]